MEARYSTNGILDQIDGIYTLFQTKMAKCTPYFRLEMLENDTLWGGTYLYGLYMGVPRGGGIERFPCTVVRRFVRVNSLGREHDHISH